MFHLTPSVVLVLSIFVQDVRTSVDFDFLAFSPEYTQDRRSQTEEAELLAEGGHKKAYRKEINDGHDPCMLAIYSQELAGCFLFLHRTDSNL